jgi:hypothetical protein
MIVPFKFNDEMHRCLFRKYSEHSKPIKPEDWALHAPDHSGWSYQMVFLTQDTPMPPRATIIILVESLCSSSPIAYF